MSHFALGIGIFVIIYVLIISERIPHTFSALLGGMMMVVFKVLDEKAALRAIELEVIFLLIGMMIIVHIMSETGIFQWVAIKIAKLVKGEPFPLMLLLVVITALFSAFLDNVTTILLIAPVSILIAEQLEIDSIPFLIAEVIASNIGGTATLIGDPPNILIGSKAGIGFNEFILNLGPVILIILVVCLLNFWFLFGKQMKVSRDLKARIMELDESRVLKDKKLMQKSLAVMFFVLLGFFTHSLTHIEPAIIAFTGAIILMIVSKQDAEDIFKIVEWKTLFFFIGLFIMVEGMVEIGAIKKLADGALHLTSGDLEKTTILILWLSAIASSIVDNIPYTTTLIPMIQDPNTGLISQISKLNTTIPLENIKYALWWALSLGACLGGNGTLVGASANVVAAGIAEKSGKKLSFMRFTKYGAFLMLQSIIISTFYLWWRYLK